MSKMLSDNSIHAEMFKDAKFVEHLKCAEQWPSHAYLLRPHGLTDALFLLADISSGLPLPDEMKLRKACAIVYANQLRLEGYHYYAEEAKQHTARKWTEDIRKQMVQKKLTEKPLSPRKKRPGR